MFFFRFDEKSGQTGNLDIVPHSLFSVEKLTAEEEHQLEEAAEAVVKASLAIDEARWILGLGRISVNFQSDRIPDSFDIRYPVGYPVDF